jgi:hypothetical protein
MSHKDNMDLRNTGDGGWFYAEHELFSVFVPLIGPDGGMVYMAMCRLIPLAAVDPDRPLTVRSCSEASGVSKSTAQRKMAQIVALGMVEEMRHGTRRPSTYKLVSLRKLGLVGIAELRGRLGVPLGDTKEEESVGYATEQGEFPGAQSHAGEASTPVPATVAALLAAKAPGGAGRDGVPRGDTEGHLRKIALPPEPVSQKQPSVSQKEPSVSQNGGFLFKEEKEEEQYSPVVPSQARGRLPSLHASANGDKPKQKPSHDAELEAAVAKVQRECGLSGRRIGSTIEAAMRLHASKVDEAANWNAIAELMIRKYTTFIQHQEFMSYKVLAPRFFAELWDDHRKWPYDEKRWRERGRV